MVKILSKSGDSLADMYDVVGSIAGVEQLLSEEVSLVHEMGGTLFSERLSTTIRRGVTGDIAQSTVFAVGFSDLPTVPFRLIGVQVVTEVVARVAIAAVMVQDDVALREFPVWVWDTTNSRNVRFFQDGAEAEVVLLTSDPAYNSLPVLMVGNRQPQSVPNIVLRGQTSAFGAGTVELTLIAYIAFAEVGGLGSRGLRVPSW